MHRNQLNRQYQKDTPEGQRDTSLRGKEKLVYRNFQTRSGLLAKPKKNPPDLFRHNHHHKLMRQCADKERHDHRTRF